MLKWLVRSRRGLSSEFCMRHNNGRQIQTNKLNKRVKSSADSKLQLNKLWQFRIFLIRLTFYISRESKTTRNVLWSRASVRLCLSVCLSAAACPHYCTDPDVTWGSGRRCALVVHYWADLQLVHGMRCYGNIMEMCGGAQRLSARPSACRTHCARTSDKIDAPAACATLSATRPFYFVHTARVLQREREMLSSTCLRVALCLVLFAIIHLTTEIQGCLHSLTTIQRSKQLHQNTVNWKLQTL